MSGLKWKWAYYPYLDPPEKQAESALKAGYIKVVNKDEAEAVIADLKDKLQKESALLKETREWLIESQKMHKRCADNASRMIRRSNRKRCLAMAMWCFDEGKGTPTIYEVRTFYWGRWGNIWLALAEEPTWERFLKLIHKEAK